MIIELSSDDNGMEINENNWKNRTFFNILESDFIILFIFHIPHTCEHGNCNIRISYENIVFNMKSNFKIIITDV